MVVVVADPRVELCLCGGQGREEPVGAELLADGAAEPFHLAGGRRRPGLGEPVGDAVLAADPVEEDLDGRLVEPAGEDLPVEFLRDVKRLRAV